MRLLILLAMMCSVSYGQHVHHSHHSHHSHNNHLSNDPHYYATPAARFYKDPKKAAYLRSMRYQRVQKEREEKEVKKEERLLAKNSVATPKQEEDFIPLDNTYRTWKSKNGTSEVKAMLIAIQYNKNVGTERLNLRFDSRSLVYLMKERNRTMIKVPISDISSFDRYYIKVLCHGWELAQHAMRAEQAQMREASKKRDR